VDEQDSFFNQHWINATDMRDWVRDSNAVAQEKGVDAVCKLVEFGGKGLARYVSEQLHYLEVGGLIVNFLVIPTTELDQRLYLV